MKLLAVDACCFTQVGIASYYADSGFASVKCCHNIEQAMPLRANFQGSHILVNLTNYCRYNRDNAQLQAFKASNPISTVIYLSRYTIAIQQNANVHRR